MLSQDGARRLAQGNIIALIGFIQTHLSGDHEFPVTQKLTEAIQELDKIAEVTSDG